VQFRIRYPGFEDRELIIEIGGFWGGPVVLVDGQEVDKTDGRYVVRDSQGGRIELRLKTVPFDPIPRLEINDKPVELAPPLKWYELVWCCLPIALLFVGGLIGGGVGGGACFLNVLIFRGEQSLVMKYALTAIVTVCAFVVYLVLAMLLGMLIAPGRS
jgi:hypothetical protein